MSNAFGAATSITRIFLGRRSAKLLTALIAVMGIAGPALATTAAAAPPDGGRSAFLQPPIRPVPHVATPAERGATAALPAVVPSDLSVADVIVSNSDSSLANGPGCTGPQCEPSIGVDPSNPSRLAITSFFGTWGNGNAPVFYSANGGTVWTKEGIPAPPGVAGTTFCPCDQTVDFGRNGTLYGTFLLDDGTQQNVVTGSTSDPTAASSWQWNGNPAQLTNSKLNSADQPQLLVNRDPTTATQDNAYSAYDDFAATNGPDSRVAASYGSIPVNMTVDNSAGLATKPPTLPVNPGLRLAKDPSNGTMWALYQQASGTTEPFNITYKLNRSTDGGHTWTLNSSSSGISVTSGQSDQGEGFKFGSVNTLLGGVDHAAVDPSTGDVYVVYGIDTSGQGNGNQLFIRRVHVDSSGHATVGNATEISSAASAALPSVAVASDGTVGVLYDTADGFTTDGFPKFSAHLARSQNGGSSFSDETIEAFTSPDKTNPSDPRQRELGDYQQLKSVGQTFYGTFSGNRLGFGSSISAIDPIFFQGQAASCAPGQASHSLTANTNVGTINGLFCVNPSTGIGTYTQLNHGSASGTGIVRQGLGTTQISAFGTNLNLAGNQFGNINAFAEQAPTRAVGTFSLS